MSLIGKDTKFVTVSIKNFIVINLKVLKAFHLCRPRQIGTKSVRVKTKFEKNNPSHIKAIKLAMISEVFDVFFIHSKQSQSLDGNNQCFFM
jgi:hypothetical protein